MILQCRRSVDDVLGELESLFELLRVDDIHFVESVHLDLDITAEPPPPDELLGFNILPQQMRLGALGPGKVAVEVHDDRLTLTLHVVSLETDERAGMGDDIFFVNEQLADQEELVRRWFNTHAGVG